MKKRLLTFGIILLLLLSTFSACVAPVALPTQTPVAQTVVSTPQVAPVQEALTTRTITDMAGRIHQIPITIDKVFGTNPVGTTLLYTLAPETLIGFNYQFNAEELAFIAPEYQNLPVFGTIKTANAEALIAAQPDMIINAAGVDPNTAAKMDSFQEQLGIPIIMVDESLLKTAEVYAFLGDLLDKSDQAKILGDYATRTLNLVQSTAIPIDEQKTIYFGNGINSLNTSSLGTPPSQAFDLISAINVCQLQGETVDRVEIDAERLISWNPDYMFINGEPQEDLTGKAATRAILDNQAYTSITAVKNGNVIVIPKTPFAWMDRPRSVNRLIGLKWAGNILYPQYFSFTNSDIIEFYSLFYHIDLTTEAIETLLEQ